MLIPGMSETMAQNIYQSGFGSFQAVAEAAVESLMAVPGYDDPEKAQKLIDEAKSLIEKYKAEGKEIPTVSAGRTSGDATARGAMASADAKSQAEERLREELAQFKAQKENE
jgi:N utilization substance protein A